MPNVDDAARLLRHLLALHQLRRRRGRRQRRLALLQPRHQLGDDRLRRDLRLAQGDVELVALLEAHLADHVREQRRAGQLLRRQPGALHVLVQISRPVRSESSRRSRLNHARIFDCARVVLASASQSRDGPRSFFEVAPRRCRPTQLVVQRHDLAVDLRAHAAVAHVGVDRVGEVERRCARARAT